MPAIDIGGVQNPLERTFSYSIVTSLTTRKRRRMMTSMPLPDSPRLMMAMTGPIIGLVSGLILGLFALVARKLLN
jgi:hypothetical protein